MISALILALALSASVPSPASAQTPPEAGIEAEIDQILALLESDPVEARRRLEPLADAGHPEALNLLAAMIELGGEHWPADPAGARALLERAAAGGSDAARLNLATRLLFEDDPASHTRAIDLLSLAEQNREVAPLTHFPWGYAYLFGSGVPQDLARGAEHIRQAVEIQPGNQGAQFLLGRAYQNGWGVARDPVLAYRHMRRAADLGNSAAQWHAGMMLLEGAGVPTDPTAAYRLVRASGEAGYVQGMISTGVMLALGQGVAEDDAEARRWYQAAAEQGSAHALRGLAFMLLSGEGGPVEQERGWAYAELARDAGDSNAGILLRHMPAPNDPRVRLAIESLKSEWVAAHGQPWADPE